MLINKKQCRRGLTFAAGIAGTEVWGNEKRNEFVVDLANDFAILKVFFANIARLSINIAGSLITDPDGDMAFVCVVIMLF